MAFVLGIESREAAINAGVVADDLLEEMNRTVPGISTPRGQSIPENLLPADQLCPRVRLVSHDAQDIKPRTDLALEFLQPAQRAGNGLGRGFFEQDRNQHVIGGRQRVHATGRQAGRAVDQDDVVVITQVAGMKGAAQAIADIIVRESGMPARHQTVFDVGKALIDRRQIELSRVDTSFKKRDALIESKEIPTSFEDAAEIPARHAAPHPSPAA